MVDDSRLLAVDLTNPDILLSGQVVIPRGSLHLFRSKFVMPGRVFERIRLTNYGPLAVEADVSVRMAADFADIFEVRGTKRAKRGTLLEPSYADGVFRLRYQGVDGRRLTTRVACTPAPDGVSGAELRFRLRLTPKEEVSLTFDVACLTNEDVAPVISYEAAGNMAEKSRTQVRTGECLVRTANEQFNAWIDRSRADLHTLVSQTPHGFYPFAGVPWFSTIFGRDGIITAMEYLWVNPAIARGVLSYLAAHQAKSTSDERDAEPGKILHEVRKGEMADLKEIPFGLYYGSIDSTPLFVTLACEYFKRTGDETFIRALWPSVEAALSWIDKYGDRDGDGFVEYERRTAQGLVNQGWKDSNDSVFHPDGSLATGPIALCEVQGYVYQAKQMAAELAADLGKKELATRLAAEARALKKSFHERFWVEEIGTYALALDGHKKPCPIRSSNAGHCLMAGIAREESIPTLVRTLFAEDSFSGWGIRTVSTQERLYNPMSYHNGSIWPHDNAMIAAGLARHGFTSEASRLLSGLFDASSYLDTQRLPELFCGFRRRSGEGPTLYPVACSPQAWAAGSVFMLLQACLGLTIDAIRRRVTFRRPSLPAYLDWLELKGLKVGDATVDLLLERHEMDVGVKISRREGAVEVVVMM